MCFAQNVQLNANGDVAENDVISDDDEIESDEYVYKRSGNINDDLFFEKLKNNNGDCSIFLYSKTM